jgi:hypothetical protein
VAEGEGFEPPVRLWSAKPGRVGRLQIAKPQQRTSHENQSQGLLRGPVLIRRLFATCRTRGLGWEKHCSQYIRSLSAPVHIAPALGTGFSLRSMSLPRDKFEAL